MRIMSPMSPRQALQETLLGQQVPHVRYALLRRVALVEFKIWHRRNLGAPLFQEEVAHLRLGRPHGNEQKK
jgi:hypothetical protein